MLELPRNYQRQALPAGLIDDGQDAELAAIMRPPFDKVISPYMPWIFRPQADDYADLYAEDGTFAVSDGWGKEGRVFAKGREALANAAGGGPGGCRDPKTMMGYGINHILTDQIIEARPEGAYGRNKLIAMSIGGDPSKNEVQGGYEDIYVKTAKGWRIKSRVHVFPNMDTSLQFGPLRKKQAEEAAKQ